MRKSILCISNLNKGMSIQDFNENFDFINQNNDFLLNDDDKTKDDYVKVKYLKGKR